MILRILAKGERNAITGAEISARLGITTRQIRKEVAKLRKLGVPICTSIEGNVKGYYLAETKAELLDTIKQLEHREEEIHKIKLALANNLERY